MYIGLHLVYPSFLPILLKLEFSQHFFEKYSNIKFHKNPSSGSRIAPCGLTDTKKLIVAFHKFANVLKNAILVTESNKIVRTVGKHWPKNTASDLSSLKCSAMSFGQPHTLQSITDLVNMGSAHTFHINITDKSHTDHKDACVQICIA